MKTPEDIKKGLRIHISNTKCANVCPYDGFVPITHDCLQAMCKDALDYIVQLESREWELFDLLSTAWYGKQYYFKQDDGTVYSRKSCEYLTFDPAIDEFATTLTPD